MTAIDKVLKWASENDIFVLGEVSNQSYRCGIAEAHHNAKLVSLIFVSSFKPLDEHSKEDIDCTLI